MSHKEQSHWGWGWAEHFGDGEQRRALGQMAEAMLGVKAGEPTDPKPLSEVTISTSNLEVPADLGSFVHGGSSQRIRHTYGRSFPEIWRGFHGDFSGAPDLVARPRRESDLEALMRWAGDHSIALVPYGGGTSVVGGVTAKPQADSSHSGWISVDMGAFDHIDPVDRIDRTARIGAGARGPAIEDHLQSQGLTLRHFPQSFEFSTLGGWLATRAGGHFATNYTRIDDLVQSIRMVTPSGIWETSRVPSTGAGPDPRQLILGSEGALGFITSAVMKLRPRPVYRSKANVLFQSLKEAVTACRRIAQAHLFPSNCRLLDRREALFNGVVTEPAHVLLLGFESADVPVDTLLEQALAMAIDAGGSCPDGPLHRHGEKKESNDAAGRWRQAFFEAPYLQSRLLSVGIIADTFETAIRWEHFPDFFDDLKSTLYQTFDEVAHTGKLTLRFTHVYPDGPAPYFTFIFSPKADPLEAWRKVRFAAADVIARHKATISHHHAVGRLHRPWLARERSPLFLQALRAVKDEVDPRAILNPGVLLPDR